MGHVFSGFTPSEKVTLQNAAIKAQTAVERAWKDIKAIKSSSAPSFAYIKWFGMYDGQRVQTVFEKISAIHFAITASSLRCFKSGAAGHYAAAYKPDEGWSLHKVKDIIKSGGYNVEYTNAFFGDIDENDGGKFPKALTFIHELSHVVANTEDEPYPPNPIEKCYGQAKCKIAAQQFPNIAVTNADNYGFYCTELLN